ncbi:MAG: DNA-methyltransferase [Candidatus Helarchaeota archaeon]
MVIKMIVSGQGLKKYLVDSQSGKVQPIRSRHKIYFQDAINMKELETESVHLILTSPPYWNIKDYGNEAQIGFNDTLAEYINKLNKIWGECVRVLKPGCKMAIDIGDMFISAKKSKQIYQIIPLHAYIINDIASSFREEMVYLGTINWRKVTTSNTSGGGKVMGSYPYPRNGYFFVNQEFIMIFRKKGKDSKPSPEVKEKSKLTLDEWRAFFKDVWTFPGIKQEHHIAMFPDELAWRLIRMYTFVGDTILDPFLGSGTTTKVAVELERNSIGFELGFQTKSGQNWKKVIKDKIKSARQGTPFQIEFIE